MSCDESKEAARAAGEAKMAEKTASRRSLPIVSDQAPEAPPARTYWRSIDEKQGSRALAAASHREFPLGASEMEEGGVSRRSFMQLLGASTALAGVACQRPR